MKRSQQKAMFAKMKAHKPLEITQAKYFRLKDAGELPRSYRVVTTPAQRHEIIYAGDKQYRRDKYGKLKQAKASTTRKKSKNKITDSVHRCVICGEELEGASSSCRC